jgi:hypothetical protein
VPGPQGAPGISGFERVVGDSGPISVNSGYVSSVAATCPAGKRAISGGFELISQGQNLTVTESMPQETDPAVWRVFFRNNTAANLARVQVRVHALCVVVQ